MNIGKKLNKNWNRMSEITHIRTKRNLTPEEEAELDYRLAIQNDFANTGKFPKDYVEVGEKPK